MVFKITVIWISLSVTLKTRTLKSKRGARLQKESRGNVIFVQRVCSLLSVNKAVGKAGETKSEGCQEAIEKQACRG